MWNPLPGGVRLILRTAGSSDVTIYDEMMPGPCPGVLGPNAIVVLEVLHQDRMFSDRDAP